ncbi:MAG: HD domain-containing protein [Candidatus Daviesbacteria bacterium]|nr:MAG: HD domain-containing protein [Candidatus Daviesbacteria bacterium]
MTRHEAYNLMIEMLRSKNLQRHGLAVEAIMRELCRYFQNVHDRKQNETEFNEEEWAIVGLLHDGDYELVEKDPQRHTLVTEEKLRQMGGISERVINGIKAHHEGVKPTRENLMEKAIYATDELAGLITAVALVMPDRKLSSVTVTSIMKKFPQKSFAAGANREQIKTCEKELNIPLEEFVDIALKAMQGISSELGL